MTEEQIAYIREAVDSLEASIQTGDYEKTIDLESFARWVMAHDILGTFDVAGSNIFLTKYNNTKDSKFMMGNLWDFDTIYRMTDDWGLAHYSYYPYFDLLFHSENRSFAQVYKNLWAEIEPTLFDTMTAFLDEFEASETGIALENSRQLDYERWKITGGATVAEDVAMGKEWFAARRSWLNDAITDIEVSSVDRIYTENDARKGTYHLSGRKALPSDGGLIISNGRKFLQKRPH
ncbi:MAG: CotH kinase family protein [Prevotella sp.]|nr:CotH kinase family protein [Prevotella sp.]